MVPTKPLSLALLTYAHALPLLNNNFQNPLDAILQQIEQLAQTHVHDIDATPPAKWSTSNNDQVPAIKQLDGVPTPSWIVDHARPEPNMDHHHHLDGVPTPSWLIEEEPPAHVVHHHLDGVPTPPWLEQPAPPNVEVMPEPEPPHMMHLDGVPTPPWLEQPVPPPIMELRPEPMPIIMEEMTEELPAVIEIESQVPIMPSLALAEMFSRMSSLPSIMIADEEGRAPDFMGLGQMMGQMMVMEQVEQDIVEPPSPMAHPCANEIGQFCPPERIGLGADPIKSCLASHLEQLGPHCRCFLHRMSVAGFDQLDRAPIASYTALPTTDISPSFDRHHARHGMCGVFFTLSVAVFFFLLVRTIVACCRKQPRFVAVVPPVCSDSKAVPLVKAVKPELVIAPLVLPCSV